MPNIRKLTDEEIRAIEARDRRRNNSQPRTKVHEIPPPVFDHIHFTTRPQPKLGDIVRITLGGNELEGIVTRISGNDDGWVAAELLIGEDLRWFESSRIRSVIGRPRGISRIDQPRRRTHGCGVRLYEGSTTRLARMFSDQKHQGVGQALKAALEFHASHDSSQQREVGQVLYN